MDGVYQRPGDPGRVSDLLDQFTRDARNVKLRETERHLEDVTDTLKSFLSQAEDALLTKELYPYWVSALGTGAGLGAGLIQSNQITLLFPGGNHIETQQIFYFFCCVNIFFPVTLTYEQE